MKKFLTTLCLSVMAMVSFAYGVEIGGVYYELGCYDENGQYVSEYAMVTSGESLYEGNISIPSTVTYESMDYIVWGIGNGAFSNCPRLTSVSLPDSLKHIGSYAFENCRMLSDITLPNGLTSIEHGAFKGCIGLSAITIPNSVTSLGDYILQECTNLQSVTLPNAITYLPGFIFSDCEKLSSIVLPQSITELGSGCFWGCVRLSHIVLPNNLTRIGNYCFNSTAMTEITIPASVIYIGGTLFCNSAKIQSIYMQGTTAPLLDGSSISCDDDITIYIPCGSLDDYQNVWGTDFNFVELNSNIQFQTAVVPEEAGHIGMAGDCDGTTAVITAQNNSGYAFLMWSDGVTTPSRTVSVTDTKTYTAMFAKALHWEVYGEYENYHFGTGVIKEGYALPNTQVTIEIPQMREGDHVFEYWIENESKNNPLTFTITQDTVLHAYYGLGGMVGEDILYKKDGETLLVEGTGDMYDGITSYLQAVEDIDWNFYMWYYLLYSSQNVALSEGITSIGKALFYDMQTLSEITIPSTITEIRARAFENCRKLKTITFADNSELETIGDWAFYNCHNLRSLTIPEGVTTIGDAAFYGCNYLTEITLPNSIQSISDNAFALCPRMQRMYVNTVVPPTIEEKTFEDVDRSIPVYVPVGTLALYQADMYWSEFFNIIEYNIPQGIVNNDYDELLTCTKLLRDGQVFIQRAGNTYNLHGQRVK